MGTNPGTASYSKRQAKRAGMGGIASGPGGSGPVNVFGATRIQAANLLVANMNNSTRYGLGLRDLSPEDIRQEARTMTTPELRTRLMNSDTRIQNVAGLINGVDDLRRNPLPIQTANRLDAARRQGQLALIGLNRYKLGIRQELRDRENA